jgi:hypothetical protein
MDSAVMSKKHDMFDDPLHRDTSFEFSDFSVNMPKRLMAEYLLTLILHEKAVAEEKTQFYLELNAAGVTF